MNAKIWKRVGKEYVCTEGERAGEILTKNQLQELLLGEVIDENKDDITHSLDLGLKFVIQKYMSKEYKCVKIKQNYDFGKVFRMSVRQLVLEANLSEKCWAFIAMTEPFIAFPTNSIVINGHTPTMEDYRELLKFGQSKLYDTLKELEDNEIIKKVKLNGQTVIYYNPFLYCSGKVVLKEVYEYFKDSKYNK